MGWLSFDGVICGVLGCFVVFELFVDVVNLLNFEIDWFVILDFDWFY